MSIAVTVSTRSKRHRYVSRCVSVAYRLHDWVRMNTECIGWRRLTPDMILDLPEEGAVFEIANLVRTVQYIGSAGGNLRARLAALGTEQPRLPACPGGYYFRYETVAQEDEALAARLDAYRTTHSILPQGNREGTVTLRVVPRRAA